MNYICSTWDFCLVTYFYIFFKIFAAQKYLLPLQNMLGDEQVKLINS